MRKSFWVILTAIILAIVGLFLIHRHYRTVIVTIPQFIHDEDSTSSPGSVMQEGAATAPRSLLLPVPFTSQAPFGNWDQLHNEACEEANSLMAAAYFNGDSRTNIPPQEADNQIHRLAQWEDQTFGFDLDTTSQQTAQMIEQVYGLQTKLLRNFSEDDLKQELAQRHLIIISEYGRALGNPNYKQPGPIHHMLLLKGYDGDNFVTNDSGTRKGLNYIYPFTAIYSAAGDWDPGISGIGSNNKIAIVVWK